MHVLQTNSFAQLRNCAGKIQNEKKNIERKNQTTKNITNAYV